MAVPGISVHAVSLFRGWPRICVDDISGLSTLGRDEIGSLFSFGIRERAMLTGWPAVFFVAVGILPFPSDAIVGIIDVRFVPILHVIVIVEFRTKIMVRIAAEGVVRWKIWTRPRDATNITPLCSTKGAPVER